MSSHKQNFLFSSNHLLSFSFLAALPLALKTKVIVRAAQTIIESIIRCVEIFIKLFKKLEELLSFK